MDEVEDKYLICPSLDDSDQIGLDSILGLPTGGMPGRMCTRSMTVAGQIN